MDVLRSMILVGALVAAAPCTALNFQPPINWSARGAVTARSAAIGGSTVLSAGADGSVVWVGVDPRVLGLALRVVARPGEAPVLDQFGDSGALNILEVNRLLASDGDTALVRMTEFEFFTDTPRAVFAVLDLDAPGYRWAQPLPVDQAVHLPQGNVLALIGTQLVRLAPGGGPRWVLDLADAVPRGIMQLRLDLAADAARAFVILGQTRPSPAGEVEMPTRILAVNLTDGSTAWNAELARPAVGVTCGRAAAGGVLSIAVRRPADASGLSTIIVERRAAVSGSSITTTIIPQVPGGQSSCRLLDSGGDLTIATADADGRATLLAVGTDGALRWRVVTGPGVAPAIVPVAGSSDVVQLSRSIDGGELRIERRRGDDGALVWAVNPPLPSAAAQTAIAASTAGLHLAIADAANFEQLDLAFTDGATLSRRTLPLEKKDILPHDARFVDGQPFDASMAADGSVVIRRLDPATSDTALWSRIEPAGGSASARAFAVELRPAGPSRIIVIVRFESSVMADPRSRMLLLMLERASGALLWRRDFPDLAGVQSDPLTAGDAGVILRLVPCGAAAGCAPDTPVLQRLLIADGSTRWQRELLATAAAFAGNDVLVYTTGSGAKRDWRRLDGGTGADVWSHPASNLFSVSSVELPGDSGYIAGLDGGSAGRTEVDVERRSLVDGTLAWTLRAGLAGDGVSAPQLRRGEDGALLLSARLSAPGSPGLVQPLLQTIDDTSGATRLMLRPPLLGDRWWSLRSIFGDGMSSTRQPLSSVRYLESLSQPFNSRVSLAQLDLASGVLRGEQLVERRFDDALQGTTAVTLSRVLHDGSVLAIDSRVEDDGLRRRVLLRLPPPGTASGDLRLRRLETEIDDTPGTIGGFGPSRTVRFEAENSSFSTASDVVFGVAQRRGFAPLQAVLTSCRVILGEGSCPTNPASVRFTLQPGAKLLLEWQVFDSTYRGANQVITTGVSGANFFVDAPWGYADVEPGNNVVPIRVRLRAFGDDFE